MLNHFGNKMLIPFEELFSCDIREEPYEQNNTAQCPNRRRAEQPGYGILEVNSWPESFLRTFPT